MAKKIQAQDLLNESTFFNRVREGQAYNTSGPPTSTAAINGVQSYAATTHTVADILQGNLAQANPEDQLLVLNKALTDRLDFFASTDEDIHGLSTFTSTLPKVNNSSGAGGVGIGAGGVVDAAWVRSLPVKHPQGGLIWMGEGKGSNEMHLPTSGNLQEDVQQHKQYPGLEPNRQHPWDMDRVGGAIGGESGYYTSPDQGPVRMKGDDAGAPGATGAFGYLDPLSEQFYISMAWPYRGDPPKRFRKAGLEDIAQAAEGLNKNEHYFGKRILVYSKETGKACVCTPGDWGPHPYYSNGAVPRASINGFCAGLSSDVHYALGTRHGAEIMVRWMPDDTPLGPYGGSSFSGDANAATGSQVTNTVEEFKHAGQLIANHPNMRMTHLDRFTEGFSAQTSSPEKYIAAWFPSINRGFFMPSLLNYLWILLEAGYSFSGSAAGYVHRGKLGGKSLSNHAKGGAIDIMGIGVNNGAPVGHSSPQWRPNNDQMFNFLATLPRDTKPVEAASSYAFHYGWYKVYKDPNPNHVHFGFNESQVGTLMRALLPSANRAPNQGIIR